MKSLDHPRFPRALATLLIIVALGGFTVSVANSATVSPATRTRGEGFNGKTIPSGWYATPKVWSVDKGYAATEPGPGRYGYLFFNRYRYTDVEVSVKALVEKKSYHGPSVFLRAKDAGNYYVCGIRHDDSAAKDRLQIYRQYRLPKGSSPSGIIPKELTSADWSTVVAGERKMRDGTWYRLKFRAGGSRLQCKAWKVGAKEPDWALDVNDDTFAIGKVGLRAYRGAHRFDGVTIRPLGVTIPSNSNNSNGGTNTNTIPSQPLTAGSNVTETFDSSSDINRWEIVNGTWNVSGGVLHDVPGADIHTYSFYAGKTYTNVDVKADVLISPGAYHHPAITLRATDANNHYICRVTTYTQEGGVDRLQILRKYNPGAGDTVVNTNWLLLATTDWSTLNPGSIQMQEGVWYTMRFQANNSTIRCNIWKRGDAESGPLIVTESTLSTGKVGLEAYSGEHQFDNVTISVL